MVYESEGSLKLYLREISQTPLLSVEEEIALAERIKQGDESAREQMIKANLRLVVKIAQDYANYGVPVLDLISEGNIGLMKAVEKFDPSKGGKLSTYGSWWIKQSIKRALANQSKTVRLPVHMVEKVAKMRRMVVEMTRELGRDPTDEDIAEMTGIPLKNVRAIRESGQQPLSLDAPIYEGEGTTYGEMIADEYAVDASDMLLNKNLHGELRGLLDILKPRERAIIEKRFRLNGYEKEFTLEEVGEEFGITRERIRQLQNLAIGKMQRALRRREKSSHHTIISDSLSRKVTDIITILTSQPNLGEIWDVLKSSDIDVVEKEKYLRNLSLGKGVNWYNLGVRALRELRKQKVHHDSHKKITYADVETFLRANIFVGHR